MPNHPGPIHSKHSRGFHNVQAMDINVWRPRGQWTGFQSQWITGIKMLMRPRALDLDQWSANQGSRPRTQHLPSHSAVPTFSPPRPCSVEAIHLVRRRGGTTVTVTAGRSVKLPCPGPGSLLSGAGLLLRPGKPTALAASAEFSKELQAAPGQTDKGLPSVKQRIAGRERGGAAEEVLRSWAREPDTFATFPADLRH